MTKMLPILMLSAAGLVAAAAGSASAGAMAEQAAREPQPIPMPSSGAGRVEFVKGDVRVRDSAMSPWRKATPGMLIAYTGEVQTGLKSQVDVRLPSGRMLSLSRMTTVKFSEMDKLAGVPARFTRQLSMGQNQVIHDARISTPSTTLAIRSWVPYARRGQALAGYYVRPHTHDIGPGPSRVSRPAFMVDPIQRMKTAGAVTARTPKGSAGPW